MRKQSSHKNTLPDWFSTDKYAQGDKASMIDWGLNLYIRNMVRGNLGRNRNGDDLLPWIIEYIALIKQYGFLPRECIQEHYDESLDSVSNDLRHDDGCGKGLVRSLPLYDAFEIYEWFKRDTELRHKLALIEYQNIFHHKRVEPLSPSEKNLAEWYDNDFRYSPFHNCYETLSPMVCVDLNAPDDKIVDAFKAWLQGMRGGRAENSIWGYPENIPGKLSDVLIDRWKRNAVLPYLDLEIHQLETGIELPMHFIGDSIFPASAEFDTTEAVRKTTKPTAVRALELSGTILHQAIRDEELSKCGKKY